MPRRYSRSEIDRFLRGRHVCILGTIGPDGASVLTPIWYLYRDGQILMRTSRDSVKARNISRDARVSVCIQYERPPYASVTAYGKASLEPADDKLAVAIARLYLGGVAGAAYLRTARQAVEQGEEVTLVITPERFLTQDFSPETPWFGKMWLMLKRVLPPWL